MHYYPDGKHSGHNTEFKARLVAWGFQEKIKPQSDSPTTAKGSFELLIALADYGVLMLTLVDI